MQNFIRLSVLLLLLANTSSILADESNETTKKAAIGGGIGGALGGVVGAELGDRKGAIIGAAVGAAIGATIATEPGTVALDGEKANVTLHTEILLIPEADADHQHKGHHKGRHCPPGQAKKGRC
ncbi:MAG: YMGG-like glycine zipper-containing protein [Gammaproteobacteria bacterium]|nr:YMGG-like glycine zipper-containing protein [Gammaproteobacteria bacterium]